MIQKWLFSVFVKKALKRGIQILVAWAASEQVRTIGVDVDPVAMTAAIWTGLEALRQQIKVNNPGWTWL